MLFTKLSSSEITHFILSTNWTCLPNIFAIYEIIRFLYLYIYIYIIILMTKTLYSHTGLWFKNSDIVIKSKKNYKFLRILKCVFKVGIFKNQSTMQLE